MSNAISIPESEQNPPEDRSPGWKDWSLTQKRWWMGSQWGEAYLTREPEEGDEDSKLPQVRKPAIGDIYESIPSQRRAVRYGTDEGGEFYPGAIARLAGFMLGRVMPEETSLNEIRNLIRPNSRYGFDPSQGLEFSGLEIFDGTVHNAWLPLALGDYIMQGLKGEFYPIAPDVLARSYTKLT